MKRPLDTKCREKVLFSRFTPFDFAYEVLIVFAIERRTFGFMDNWL